MKQLGKALQAAGLKFSPVSRGKVDRYKLLHLPSAQYVMIIPRNTTKGNMLKAIVAIFPNKAKAGHARDLITGKRQRKYGETVVFLSPPVPETQLHKSCFEFILVEEENEVE